jgi:hypothetical protein
MSRKVTEAEILEGWWSSLVIGAEYTTASRVMMPFSASAIARLAAREHGKDCIYGDWERAYVCVGSTSSDPLCKSRACGSSCHGNLRS